MEVITELGIEFYGSYVIAMLVLIAWLYNAIQEKKESQERCQETLDKQIEVSNKLNELLVSMNTYIKAKI